MRLGVFPMSTETASESSHPAHRSSRLFTIFLVIACVALSVEVMLLVRKNRNLEESLSRAPATTQIATVEPGDVFEPLVLMDESGEEMTVEFGDGQAKSLMLVFTMACSACETTFPVWSEIVPVEDTPRLRVIAIRLDGEGALDEASVDLLPFPVHSADVPDTSSLRKISAVPATILLDAYGVVEKVWSGALSREDADALRETIDALIEAGH